MLSMSDQSGASDSDLDRYEHQPHDDSDGEDSRSEERGRDSDEDGDVEEDIPIKDVSSVHLCHDHKGCDTIYEKQKLIVDIEDEGDSDEEITIPSIRPKLLFHKGSSLREAQLQECTMNGFP